jgi:hypothetical protein
MFNIIIFINIKKLILSNYSLRNEMKERTWVKRDERENLGTETERLWP